jgi:hypothetical protein
MSADQGLKHQTRNNCCTIISYYCFIRKKSTCTNLLESVYDWSLNLQNRAGTDIIYFDFKKALNSVSHPKPLTKLKAYGISGLLLAWINDF